MNTRFLGISGSIRPGASSSVLLQHIGTQLSGEFTIFNRLADIPAFDGSEVLPPSVHSFVDAITAADYVLICSPEYAHGVPGALKNALDWTVATNVWTDKPIAIITAAAQGDHAHASLIEILSTMSAAIQMDSSLLIPFVKAKISSEGAVTDADLQQAIHQVLQNIRLTAVRKRKPGTSFTG